MTMIATSDLDHAEQVEILTRTAANEHLAVVDAATGLLDHAIQCGEALIKLQTIIPPGQWSQWLPSHAEELGFKPGTAWTYMRLARNKDEVLKAGVSSVVAGRDMIRGFERSRSIWSQRNDHVRKEALALVSAGGKTHAEVAELVGVSTGVLRSWLYPETARRADAKYRDIKRNRRELQKIKDREESARRAGVSDAYSQIRKLANSLDGIYRTGANPEIRAAAGSALKHVHKAEDEFIKALRSLRQTIDAEAVRNARS